MYLGPTQPASRTPANNVPPPLIESITYGDSYQESRFAIEQTKPNGCKYTYSAHFNSGHFVVSVRNLIIPCPAFHHMASDRAALPIRPPHSLVLSPGNHHGPLVSGMFRYGALNTPWNQKPTHKHINWAINVTKNKDAHQQSRHRKAVAAEPAQVALRCLFTHEEQDHRAAVERRNGKKVEGAQQQVQREKNKQSGCREITMPCDGIGMKPPFRRSQLQSGHSDQHQQKICRRSGKSHPTRPPRMPPFPQRVVRSARPSHHPISVHHQVGEDRDHYHSPRLAPHVRHGVQRDLAAESRCFVASYLGDQRVRRLVTRGRKEECYEPDESEDEKIGIEIRQGNWPFRLLSPSRLEVVAQLCKPPLLRPALRAEIRAIWHVGGKLQPWQLKRTKRRSTANLGKS